MRNAPLRMGVMALAGTVLCAACEDDAKAPIDASVAAEASATDGPAGDGSVPADGSGATIDPICRGQIPIQAACSNYCSNVTRNCREANAQFASPEECQAACNKPTWSCGGRGDQTGNTIFCRSTYAGSAASDPASNCPKAGPNSAACK